MITLNCPDCGEKYELDDDMAGKKAACKCGAVLFIPKTPDLPEGKKSCPTCNTITDNESVLCVSCGFNFETGGRTRSAESRVEDEEEDARITFLRRFWKPIAGLIVIALIGMVVYSAFFAKHYGISSSNPLGTLTSIEDHLKQASYQKEPASKSKIPDIFGSGAKKIEWKDVKLAKLSQGMYREKVFIILSPENNILAIGAKFKGGVKTIPGDTGSRSGRFMSSFWNDCDLQTPPNFQEVKKKYKYFVSTYNQAVATTDSVCGRWIEYPEEITILPSSHTMVITDPKFKDITYDDIQGNELADFMEKIDKKKETRKEEKKR